MVFCLTPMPSLGADAPAPAAGYEGGFVANSYGTLLIHQATGNPPISVNLYESTRNSDLSNPGPKRYGFTPYFQFVQFNEGSGWGKYRVISMADGTKTVKLSLDVYDDALKSAVAKWASVKSGAYVSPADVEPLPISTLTIHESASTLTASYPENGGTVILPPTLPVYFRHLTAASATLLTSAIDQGAAQFTFKFAYQKASNVIGAYAITYEDVRNTGVFQQLTGVGGSGLVTRAGGVRLADSISNQLQVSSYLEYPGDAKSILNDLITLFNDKMHFAQDIHYEDRDQMRQLSALGIDPKGPDFEAQRIETTHDLIASSSDVHDLNKKLNSGGANLGYGKFTAGANFSNNSEVETAIKETFSHDWTGNNWANIPKTVSVYQINSSDFSGSSQLRLVNVQASFSQVQLTSFQPQYFLDASQLANLAASGIPDIGDVPIGTVIAFSGPIDANHPVPTGWMLCDGAPLSKTAYPQLFDVVGTLYGDGRDHSGNKASGTDFNLPDFRGLFLRGVNGDKTGGYADPDVATRAVMIAGATASGGIGSVQSDQVGPHIHAITDPGHSHNVNNSLLRGDRGGGVGRGGSQATLGIAADNPNITATSSNGTGISINSNGTSESRPRNVAVYYLIRIR
jgi:microcystin-dependent protein